jgi:hypothetical protein
MQTATHHGADAREGVTGPAFVSLDRETRAAVDTATAAYHLNRQPQTLRPLRVHGRLAWPVAELRRVLGLRAVSAQ